MKKALNLYTPRNYATFSSQSYYKYKTMTHSQQSQQSGLDLVPTSIRARNAHEINITNCDVTTWSWVNLVNPILSLRKATERWAGPENNLRLLLSSLIQS